jgi:hypothetical protein
MQHIQVPIGNLPIQLACIMDGTIAFLAPQQQFATIIEGDTIISNEEITIKGESYQYNCRYSYKDNPDMLEWLQQQKLQNPFQI